VYNTLLAGCKKQYEENGKSNMKTPANLKKNFEWLKEVDSMALCNAQMNLKTAYSRFFQKKAKFPTLQRMFYPR
jgi:putative transposase